MEVKTEADSNDITECSRGDKPTIGMCCFFCIHSSVSHRRRKHLKSGRAGSMGVEEDCVCRAVRGGGLEKHFEPTIGLQRPHLTTGFKQLCTELV